jgi:hypothetical protein
MSVRPDVLESLELSLWPRTPVRVKMQHFLEIAAWQKRTPQVCVLSSVIWFPVSLAWGQILSGDLLGLKQSPDGKGQS